MNASTALRAVLIVSLSLVAAGCGRSGGQAPLAAGTVGPDGGELLVTSGPQAGLRLVVPPGALVEPVALRIVDVLPVGVPGGATGGAAVQLPGPGDAFRIEPEGLRLVVPGTLEVPYRLYAMRDTAPGNVRIEHVRDLVVLRFNPTSVDVVAGRATMPIRTFGQYQVVVGPLASSLAAYRPAVGAVVPLASGYTFSVEAVPAALPAALATPTSQCWRLEGPSASGGTVAELLYFDGDFLLGRSVSNRNWVEVFADAALVWQDLRAQLPFAVTTPTTVHYQGAPQSTTGLITVSGSWNWTEPVTIDSQLVYDVLQLSISLAWQRQDLGTGQRSYRFLFAPEIGLLGVVVDGVSFLRAAL